jgi:hypothetical protein
MKLVFLNLFIVLSLTGLKAQIKDSTTIRNNTLDSLFIQEVENKKEPSKVLHAEPLYIDLIRDLGDKGQIRIVGAMYEMETGNVEFY